MKDLDRAKKYMYVCTLYIHFKKEKKKKSACKQQAVRMYFHQQAKFMDPSRKRCPIPRDACMNDRASWGSLIKVRF
jgi:hypothetical protein